MYHIIARGNQRRDVFHDEADRRRYLTKLAHYKQRYAFRFFAYVLMTNHVEERSQVERLVQKLGRDGMST